MSLNEDIINIRVELQNAKLKKSGKNKFAGFDYYELSDFLPTLNSLMHKHNVNDRVTFTKDEAVLTLIKGEEKQDYSIPFIMFDTPLSKNGQKSMQDIQYLGALNTYYKRYLYLNAFGITDGEVIDAMDNSTIAPAPSKATEEDIKVLMNEFKNTCELYNADAKEFIIFKFGEEVYNDKKLLYKEVRAYMKNMQNLQADLEVFSDRPACID